MVAGAGVPHLFRFDGAAAPSRYVVHTVITTKCSVLAVITVVTGNNPQLRLTSDVVTE